MLMAASFIFACSKKSDSAPATPAPTADFSYVIEKEFSPTNVAFTSSATNASSYTWDFGDNTSSNSANPTKLYTKGGVYTVRLTATGAGGSKSITKTVNIPDPATKVTITRVTITSLETMPSGNFDYFISFFDKNVVELARSTVVTNVNSTLFPQVINFGTSGYVFNNINENYVAAVYRRGLLSNTLLGLVTFSPSLYITGSTAYPITFDGVNLPTRMTFAVQWRK